MSRPNITIENHGNVYFCCKCFYPCGKDCKCEGSKCSSIKVNEHSNGISEQTNEIGQERRIRRLGDGSKYEAMRDESPLKSSRSSKKSNKKSRGSKSSTKIVTNLGKTDRDLANQVNVQELATNEIVTARESKSLTNVNREDNVRANSMSKTSIDAENIEQVGAERKIEGASTYLAPHMDSGCLKRFDASGSERNASEEKERSEKAESERKTKIEAESAYLNPKMESNQDNSKRLDASTQKTSASKDKEDVEKSKRSEKSESERKVKVEGDSTYLAPTMDSDRSKRLDASGSARKMNASQEKKSSETSGSKSMEQSGSKRSERNLNVFHNSDYFPQLRSSRSDRLSSLRSERHLDISQGQDDFTPKRPRKSNYVNPQLDLLDQASTGSKNSSSKSSGQQMEMHQSQVTTDGLTTTQESMDIYFLQQKHIELKANVDGAPVTTTLTLNIKSKNKDAKVVMQEMYVDGERVFSRENATKQ
jgi:hypothetical protein